MACDLQFTYAGHTKFKGTTKVLVLEGAVPQEMFKVDKAYIGFSGNADAWGEVVSWFCDISQKPPRCKNIEFLMLTSEKKIWHGTNLRNWMYLPEKFFAVGSGCQFALAAMSAGKSPKEAIAIASKHDPSTGMGIKEYTL